MAENTLLSIQLAQWLRSLRGLLLRSQTLTWEQCKAILDTPLVLQPIIEKIGEEAYNDTLAEIKEDSTCIKCKKNMDPSSRPVDNMCKKCWTQERIEKNDMPEQRARLEELKKLFGPIQ